MTSAAQECFEATVALLNERYKAFCAHIGRTFEPLPWKARVLPYQALYEAVRAEQGETLDRLIQEKCAEWLADSSLDTCARTTKLVEFVHGLWSDQNPVIIVYFTPPYYPHVHATGANEKERRLLAAVDRAMVQEGRGYQMKRRNFFPCISDLSYAAAPDDPEALSAVSQNTPGFGTLYRLPLDALKKLKIPVSMIGTYGYDAHKYTERLEKAYSFETMPDILRSVIRDLLV